MNEAGGWRLEAGSARAKNGRAPIKSFRDLEVYQRARAARKTIEMLVRRFPDHERYLLCDQMRRASRSVTSTIAEGHAKRSSATEFKRYLRMSLGSSNEMESHLETAYDFGYMTDSEWKQLIGEYETIGKQLTRLIETWRSFDRPASSVQPPASRTLRI